MVLSFPWVVHPRVCVAAAFVALFVAATLLQDWFLG